MRSKKQMGSGYEIECSAGPITKMADGGVEEALLDDVTPVAAVGEKFESSNNTGSTNTRLNENSPSYTYNVNNYLIYTICKKREGVGDSAFADIVEKILKEAGIQGIIVNSRIVNIFRKKMYVLLSKVIAARKKAGWIGSQRLLNGWKNKSYSFTVYYHEVDKCALQQENQELRGQKRILEDNIVDEVAKRLKVEEKLQQALAKSEKSCSYYKKRFKNIVKKVINANKQGKRGPQKNKSFNAYTPRHQIRIKTQLKEHCNSALSFMGLYDFIATKVEIFNAETQEHDTLQLVDEDQLPFTESNPKTLNNEDIDNIT